MRCVRVGPVVGDHEGLKAGHDAGHDAVANFNLGAGVGGCAVIGWVVRVEHVVEVV